MPRSARSGNHPGGAQRTRVFSRKLGSGSGIHSRGCLLIAGGDERRVQPDGAFRVALRYQRGDRSEFVDNEELRVFSDVAAWLESLLHREFEGGAHRSIPLNRSARNAESSPRWK
jgi:hypothetical protein